MYLYVSSYGLADGKRWASKVVENTVARLNDLLFPVEAAANIELAISFDSDEQAVVRSVLPQKKKGDAVQLCIFIPVADWENRNQARPLAESAIISCLLDVSEKIGVDSDKLLDVVNEAEIDIIMSGSVQADQPTMESTDGWIQKFTVPSILTSLTDAYGPVGSDTGADVLELYRKWRQDKRPASKFLNWLLSNWEIDAKDQAELNSETLAKILPNEYFNILNFDDVVIALAFSQYFVDGKIIKKVYKFALNALERQSLDAVLEFRNWSSKSARIEALTTMRDFIERI